MRYVKAKIQQEEQLLAYRIYITDSLMFAPQQMHLNKRWFDIVEPQNVDMRTGDEIAEDIISRLQLRM